MGVVVRASASGVSLSCIECKACDLGECVDLVDATEDGHVLCLPSVSSSRVQ